LHLISLSAKVLHKRFLISDVVSVLDERIIEIIVLRLLPVFSLI
jgi:hypothetical protein